MSTQTNWREDLDAAIRSAHGTALDSFIALPVEDWRRARLLAVDAVRLLEPVEVALARRIGTLSSATRSAYAGTVGWLARALDGEPRSTLLSLLTSRERCEELLRRALEAGDELGLKPSSLKHRIRCLLALVSAVKAAGVITWTPEVPLPEAHAYESTRFADHTAVDDAVSRLVAGDPAQRRSAAILCLAQAGLRTHEIATLSMVRVTVRRGWLLLRGSVTRALFRRLTQAVASWLSVRGTGPGFLFPSPTAPGQPMTTRSLQRAVGASLAAVGLRGIDLRSIRATSIRETLLADGKRAARRVGSLRHRSQVYAYGDESRQSHRNGRRGLGVGRARGLTAEQESLLVALVKEPPPTPARRWTLRLAAKEAVERGLVTSISQETLRLTLIKRCAALNPRKPRRRKAGA